MDLDTTGRADVARRSPVLRVGLPVALALAAAIAGVAAVLSGVGGRWEATLPPGTVLVAALDRTITTEQAQVGDPVELAMVMTTQAGGKLDVPAGSVLRGEVTHTRAGGRIAGAPELTLRFIELEVEGDSYGISTEPLRIRGQRDAADSSAQAGGELAGGGADAVKGAPAGEAIGSGVAVATQGEHIVLPAGQQLKVRLADPVTLSLRPQTES